MILSTWKNIHRLQKGVKSMNSLGERRTLLLVDDTELFLKLQISYLGNRRFEIHTARSGAQALQMVHKVKPDLILLDMFMQDMTGDFVCRLLKSNAETSSISVVIISSCSREDTRKRAMDAGCDGLIFKPVRKDHLMSVVEDCLGIKMRRHVRANVALPGIVLLNEREMATTIHSLSVGGAFLEIDAGAATDEDLLGLQFHLPGSEEEITVDSAAVVWRGSLEKDGPQGAGIRFMNILPESTNHISRYLTDILAKEVREEHVTG